MPPNVIGAYVYDPYNPSFGIDPCLVGNSNDKLPKYIGMMNANDFWKVWKRPEGMVTDADADTKSIGRIQFPDDIRALDLKCDIHYIRRNLMRITGLESLRLEAHMLRELPFHFGDLATLMTLTLLTRDVAKLP